jgi:hypothetical protein
MIEGFIHGPDALSGSIADPQSFNHYIYAANDPVNLVDSLGLDPDIDIGIFFAGDVVAQPGMVGTFGFDGELGMVITPTKPQMPEPSDPDNQSASGKELSSGTKSVSPSMLKRYWKTLDLQEQYVC